MRKDGEKRSSINRRHKDKIDEERMMQKALKHSKRDKE